MTGILAIMVVSIFHILCFQMSDLFCNAGIIIVTLSYEALSFTLFRLSGLLHSANDFHFSY